MTDTAARDSIAGGYVLRPDEARDVDLAGHRLSFLAVSSQTAGRFSVFEARNRPCIADRHIHHDAVKAAYILEGHYRWHVGDRSQDVAPGGFVLVPRHVAHHFEAGPEGGRQLFIFSPAGAEDYFVEEAQLIAEDAVTAEAVAELHRRYSIEAVPIE